MLLVDLDRFKHVNETHGHAVGDRAPTAVAVFLFDVDYFKTVNDRPGHATAAAADRARSTADQAA